MLPMCQNNTMRVYGAWIITFYVQKHIAVLAMCHNPSPVHDKLLGSPTSVILVYYIPQYQVLKWSRVLFYIACSCRSIEKNEMKPLKCGLWSIQMLLMGPLIQSLIIWIPIVLGLTHWGQVTHICVSKLTVIGSDNGLLPGRHQAIN